MHRLITAVAALLAILALALPAAAQTTGPDYDLPGGGHFYTQANGGAGAQYGYRITDEGGIGFWTEFQRLGGVTALGYPSSRRFQLDGFTVQATQKVIMQWRPEVSQVYFVNVFDKLHDMGLDGALQANFQIPPQLDPSFDAGKTPGQIQAARLALLSEDASIAAKFNASSNPILYNGLPTSHAANQGPFVALRAQRVAFQHWTQAGPGGIKPGDVSVVNGGDIAKQLGLVPASAATPETASGQLAPTPSPSAPPAPAATPTPAASPFHYQSQSVTTAPVDCNNDPTISAIPCLTSAPNVGTQYIKGRVMDQQGKHLQFVTVQATIPSGCSSNGQTVDCVQQTQTAGDGTFTFLIAGAGTTTGSCPPYALTYRIMVLSPTGAQDSDVYTVNYNGNCTQAGEFHFDFVKVR